MMDNFVVQLRKDRAVRSIGRRMVTVHRMDHRVDLELLSRQLKNRLITSAVEMATLCKC